MKLQKQFKDLILNGTKKYEFRNNWDKAGFYNVGQEKFYLRLLRDVWFYHFSDLIKFIQANYDYDYDSLKWIEKNPSYFECNFQTFYGSFETKYHIFIYEWINLKDIDEHLKEILWID